MSQLWTLQTDPNSYPSPPQPPTLTSQICLSSQQSLREFLTLSRHATDDVLKQRLNSRFNDERLRTKEEICKDVINEYRKVWKQRNDIITYCDIQAKKQRSALENDKIPVENDKDQLMITNEELRHNPYALKDIQAVKEQRFAKLELLENWLRNETFVEKIVMKRSLDIFKRNCGEDCV